MVDHDHNFDGSRVTECVLRCTVMAQFWYGNFVLDMCNDYPSYQAAGCGAPEDR